MPPLTPWRLIAPAALLLFGACSLPTRQPFEATAAAHQYRVIDLPGDPFRHRIYLNRLATPPVKRLHVYIDGDGSPWFGPGRPAADPTPRNPLVLRLMAQDPHPALYLGRPCYAGITDPQACHPWHWTHGRYGERIVASMATVLEQLASRLDTRQLILIGYSGGGTLAMLLARRVDGISDVVTLAGNLDTQAWANHHGYSALSSSLNPATREPLPNTIRQWHWAGADDQVVPPDLAEKALQRQQGVHFRVLEDVDHSCCWEREWPGLLEIVESAVGED